MHGSDDDWNVLVMRHGTLATRRSEVFHDDAGMPDAPYTLDYYAWVVRRGGEAVCVVDLGFSADEADRRGRTRIGDLASRLRALGIGEQWAGDVVLTHLHYDHTGLVGQLPHARLYVAAAELAHWLDDGHQDGLESTADLDALRAARAQGRVVPVHGDHVLHERIAILAAAGHTPGQVMVRVGHPASPGVLVASDAAHFDEEYLHERPFHAMHDLDAARRSYGRIRALRERGDRVLAGHESGIVSHARTLPDDPETAVVPMPTAVVEPERTRVR